jgi:two-component system nitrate/nitrite response regulator NarL
METKNKAIKVLLVDDHPLVREGIRSSLSRHDHIRVVGEAQDGDQVLPLVRKLSPNVILLDLSMPKVGGLKVTGTICREFPKVKILILTVHINDGYVREVIRSGARGYLLKDGSPAELVRAIEAVHEGGVFFCPAAAQVILNDYLHQDKLVGRSGARELSPRECQVLTLIADDHSNKEIASRLGVGVRTVESHREKIMRKLDVHSVIGLTKYAISNGLIRLRQNA